MPELPEVETIVADLRKPLTGLCLVDFGLLHPLRGQLRPQINLSAKVFKTRIVGQKVITIKRRAKLLVFELDKDILLIHLKMTGQLVLESCKNDNCSIIVGGHPIVNVSQDLPNKFTRAVLTFSDDSKLYFNDVRRFGWLRLIGPGEWVLEEAKLGLEPFDRKFTVDFLAKMLARKPKSTVKQTILEQKYLVGVGNIYADEALFIAKVKPLRLAKSLTIKEVQKLHQAIIKILRQGIKYRGTSFSDYRDASGKKGNFLPFLRVYGRAKLPCKICGQPISKTKIGGRGTHWCNLCQM
ncbi:MAG: DNA-formamidopyrimidine glycosylase [Candidatus Falkowbacteria bacterium]